MPFFPIRGIKAGTHFYPIFVEHIPATQTKMPKPKRLQFKPKIKLKTFAFYALIVISLASVTLAGYTVFAQKAETPPPSTGPIKVKIQYDDQTFKTETRAATVAELLKEQNIQPASDDYIFPGVETPVSAGLTVIIQKKIPITIKVDGRTIELKTFVATVEEALEEADVTLSHLDQVSPRLASRASHGLEIEVTRINIEEITEEEPIEFETVTQEDPQLKWRSTKIIQAGKNGVRKNKFRIVYQNGQQVSKEKLSSKISKKPKNEIIAQGTKIEVGQVSKGRASWYKHTGDLKCASLEHPIGTWLRVTNLDNKKQVIVQVNDRGPFSKDKIIDLDAVAFKKIGGLGQGVARVKVEEILE